MELPALFVESMRSLLGAEDFVSFESALAADAPSSIRLNESKLTTELCFQGKAVPWCVSGRYLEKRPSFTFDPLFHAGCYYVQETSSMFLAQALQQYLPEEAVVALDLCAAPGGKSTLMRSLLPDGSLLVANEVMKNRVQILAENLTKWGNPDVVVTQSDPSAFGALPEVFDVMLTDVPCSGEGMFRKDPVAVEEWSPENVELCWQRQRRILSDVWPALKPGGLLIYSTCTFNTLENEENVRWICEELGAEVLPVSIDESWRITGNMLADADFPVYRFLPHRTQGEGLFLVVLRKAENAGTAVDFPLGSRGGKKGAKNRKKGGQQGGNLKEISAKAARWLELPDKYTLQAEEDELRVVPASYVSLLERFRDALRIVQCGTPVGSVKGKDLIPAHAVAMSMLLKRDAFPAFEVNYEQAIAFLRKEAMVLDAEVERGYVLLTYRHVPIGFVKHLGNRANNLYPQEWRIRSSYLPEDRVMPYIL